MSVAAYSRTEAGIRRIAAERRQAMLSAPTAPEQVEAPVAAPVAEPEPEPESNVVTFRTPKDEIRRIVDLVARMHGATYLQVMSRLRSERIANARMAAICAIIQARPDMSLTRLGLLFDRDHTTILNSLRKRGFQ